MGSFTGDILRLLAHQGLQTGGQLLGQALAIPMAEKAAMRQHLGKQLIEGAGAVPEEGMPALNEKLVELMGEKGRLPSFAAKTGNVVGPSGQSLAMTPAPGVELPQETQQRFLRPAVGMDTILGSAIAQSPELRDKILAIKAGGLTPKDMLDLQYKGVGLANTIEDQRLRRLEAERSHRANEGLRREMMTQQVQNFGETLGIRRDMYDLQKDRISNEAARAAYLTLQSAHGRVLDEFKNAEKYDFKNLSGVQSAIDAHNELLRSVQKQFSNVPEIATVKPVGLGKELQSRLGGLSSKEVPILERQSPAVASPSNIFRGPDGKDYKEGDILPNGKPLRNVNGKWVF